jgi:trans-aconitate 2-methyltransferase
MSIANTPEGEAYQYGDTAVAAARLRLLAEVFAPSTRQFLESLVALAPRTILDLGCGPGHTTRLMAEVFGRAEIRGVDSSAAFIALARQVPVERVTYEVANATQPLAGGPYDLIYCRYLVTHLARWESAVALWSESLRPGGLLAIEENDWIQSDQPAFSAYVNMVAAMLAAEGQNLYVATELDGVERWPLLSKRSSELAPVAVSNRDAAGMFLMNLDVLRSKPFIEQNYPAAQLDRLRNDLARLADDDPRHSSITFGRRRLVLARIKG